jgi:hypothetical protein
MATLLETWHPDLFAMNPKNPREREQLQDGYKRIETQLARAQGLVENDPHTHGHRHSERLIATRDRFDAILNELHSKVYGIDTTVDLEECRSRDCRQTALPPYEGSGYCASCLTHVKNRTRPTFDQTQPAKAIVGSPWGRDN